MIENLKNQERLSFEEEDRIDKKIRIVILVSMAAVIAIILWSAFQKKTFGTLYYAGILALLAGVWFVKYVLAAILKHSLAGRTDEEVSAYLKAAGLELVAYAGLGWFLLAMSGNGIFGAVVYMFGVTGARKQMETYYGTNKEQETEEAQSASETAEEGQDGPDQPSDAKVAMISSAGPDALPSAADRQQREKEQEDGSV